MEIKKIAESERKEALGLAWEVFQTFEAPDYSQEGTQTFKEFLDEQLANPTIALYGAFENNALLGVIATRSEGSHIALFFVKEENHGQGIGRKLFDYIVPLGESSSITVNSSPYAAKIYRSFGFVDTDTEQLTNGIRYIPMRYEK